MGKILTDRAISKTNHIFMNKPDYRIGCSLKSVAKKAKNIVKKGFKGLQKAEDLVNNLQKKAITTLGTNKKIRDIVEAVPFGDQINAVTKVASDVVKVTDKMNEKIKKKENPFDKDIKEDVKKVITDAKNDPGIKKLIDQSKDMIKSLFGKVDKSDLPQSEKEEIKDKAETINLGLINDAKSPSSAGKLAKNLPYAMFVDRNSKKPKIPKKYVSKFGIPQKTLDNTGGRLFLTGGRLGLGLSLTTPTPDGGKLIPELESKPRKATRNEIMKMIFD